MALNATQAMLTEARSQYHLLMTGRSARVVVDQGGERVEFTAANSSKLKVYIQELEQELGLITSPYSGPARFTF